MPEPAVYYVLFHTPGPRWQAGVGFREQDGVRRHVDYMAEQMAAGRLVIGGPFLDDSGGMMVLRAATLDEAAAIAHDDPTVIDGLLRVDVKLWMAAMETLSGGKGVS